MEASAPVGALGDLDARAAEMTALVTPAAFDGNARRADVCDGERQSMGDAMRDRDLHDVPAWGGW